MRNRTRAAAFDQTGIDRDDDMGTFVVQVQEWAGGSLTTSFSTPEELRDRVTRALADHAVRDQAGRIDDEEILGRAMDLVPADRNQGSDVLVVAIAAGPSQQVLRPGEIEGGELCRELKREAMFGAAPVLDSNLGARCQVRGDLLSVTNDAEVLILDPLGSVATFRPARRRRDTITGLNPLIEEDVAEAIEGALRFAGIVLKMVDPTERLTAVAPLAAVLGSPLGWRTRAEQAASPNSMSVGSGTRCNEGAVRLSPITRPRRQLTLKSSELAEDLTVLLRRQMKS